MSYVNRFSLLSLTAAALAASGAHAQDLEDRNQLTVGVGAGVVPSYDGSDDSVVTPGAVVRGKVEGFTFFSRGPYLFVDAIPDAQSGGLDIEAGPVGGARFNRTRQIKDRQVRALGELDTAWEVGGWGGVAKTGVITSDYDNLSFRVSYLHDVAGAHRSYIVTPTIEYGTPLSRSTYVGVSVSADYVGKGFGRYYYDVTLAGSQASGLGVYGAAGDKAGFAKLNLGIVGAKSLSGDLRKGLSIFALGGYGRILGRYADSPIVRDAGSRNQWVGGAGIAYTF
nr:MipA/OmpV family protein [Sphingobium subterraneum]